MDPENGAREILRQLGPYSIADAYKTVGILARGQDEAAIWESGESKDPFRDGKSFFPVAGGQPKEVRNSGGCWPLSANRGGLGGPFGPSSTT